MEVTIYTDGASRGNPGAAAIAYIICSGEKIVSRHSGTIGRATNNEAEYRAIIAALGKAAEMKAERVVLYSDSELVVRQLIGVYRIKEKRLRELSEKVKSLEKRFKSVKYNNLRRTDKMISFADSMVNEALDSS